MIASGITTDIVRNKNGQSVLDFCLNEYLGEKELNSFWLEIYHDLSNKYLSNKTAAINQNLRSTTAFLIGSIHYEFTTDNPKTQQTSRNESLNRKHVLILEDIFLLFSLN